MARNSTSPGPLGRLKIECWTGRGRSPSIKSTFAPEIPETSARLAAIVDFPAPGSALVTTTFEPVVAPRLSTSASRSARMLSTEGEPTSISDGRPTVAPERLATGFVPE